MGAAIFFVALVCLSQKSFASLILKILWPMREEKNIDHVSQIGDHAAASSNDLKRAIRDKHKGNTVVKEKEISKLMDITIIEGAANKPRVHNRDKDPASQSSKRDVQPPSWVNRFGWPLLGVVILVLVVFLAGFMVNRRWGVCSKNRSNSQNPKVKKNDLRSKTVAKVEKLESDLSSEIVEEPKITPSPTCSFMSDPASEKFELSDECSIEDSVEISMGSQDCDVPSIEDDGGYSITDVEENALKNQDSLNFSFETEDNHETLVTEEGTVKLENDQSGMLVSEEDKAYLRRLVCFPVVLEDASLSECSVADSPDSAFSVDDFIYHGWASSDGESNVQEENLDEDQEQLASLVRLASTMKFDDESRPPSSIYRTFVTLGE